MMTMLKVLQNQSCPGQLIHSFPVKKQELSKQAYLSRDLRSLLRNGVSWIRNKSNHTSKRVNLIWLDIMMKWNSIKNVAILLILMVKIAGVSLLFYLNNGLKLKWNKLQKILSNPKDLNADPKFICLNKQSKCESNIKYTNKCHIKNLSN